MTDALFAMISSSTLDLAAHRQAALDACLRQRVLPRMMEHEPAADRDASQLSLDLVAECDVYVLVLGFRYGSVPPGGDRSYTHLEYEHARATGKGRIVLLMSEEHDLKPRDVETGPGATRLTALREQVASEQVVQFFSSPEDMRAKLITELARLREARPAVRDRPPTALREPTPPDPFRAQPYSLLNPDELVGRRAELESLKGWVGDPRSPLAAHRVLVLTAIGGMGKSALAWRWFHDLAGAAGVTGRIWWSFYEEGAHFDAFVLRTLAYVTRVPAAELMSMAAPERIDRLLDVLDTERHIIVLDGLERLLLAYARPDAAHVSDASVEEAAGQALAEVRGSITGTGGYAGNARLRTATDPRVGMFLRRVAGLRASRVLITSRLYPRELQRPTGTPIPGSAVFLLHGLSDADALQLWSDSGCFGDRDELHTLLRSFGNYPLLIRALAAEVAEFRPAPGDYSTWRQAHPGFDPLHGDLLTPDDRRSHVLRYALDGLTDLDRQVLQVIAAITGPVTYPILSPLVLAPQGPVADDARLDEILTGLEDRGLLGWDRATGRYELHPVVRGVALAGLDEDAQQKIYQRLADHFGSLPETDVSAARTIDDLADPLRLVYLSAKAGEFHAVSQLVPVLIDSLIRIRALDTLLELLEMLEQIPALDATLRVRGSLDNRWLSRLVLGMNALLSGDPNRALGYFDPDRWTGPPEEIGLVHSVRSRIMAMMGDLGRAEQQAREAIRSVAHMDLGVAALGELLLITGDSDAGRRWLRHHVVAVGDDPSGDFYGDWGWDAIRRADVAEASACAILIDRKQHVVPEAGLYYLFGALYRLWGDDERADAALHEALAGARAARQPDDEIKVRIELARLHLGHGRVDAAREQAVEATALAERYSFRVLLADAQLTLAEIEHAAPDPAAALAAADAAYRSAWCDGGRYSRHPVLDRASELIESLGGSPPDDLPVPAPPALPPLQLQPRSLAEYLRELCAVAEPDPDALQAAANRVRYAAPDPELGTTLLQLARSGGDTVRAVALSALRDVAMPPADDLADLGRTAAADPVPSVRRAAVRLLADAPDSARLEELVRIDPDPGVQNEALLALIGIDPDNLRLVDAVGDADVRASALWTAATNPQLNPSDVLRRHVREDPGAIVRIVCGAGLLLRSPPDAPLVRETACADPDPTVRGGLLAAMAGVDIMSCVDWAAELRAGKLRAGATEPGTLAFLDRRTADDPDRAVRVLAAVCRGPSARAGLVDALLVESDPAEADLLVAAITGLGGPAPTETTADLVPLLTRGLSSGNAYEVMRWLVAAGTTAGRSAVRAQLTAAERDARLGAVAALAETRDDVDRRLITRDLDSMHPCLDPQQDRIDAARIAAAVAATELPAAEVERRYAAMAQEFGFRSG